MLLTTMESYWLYTRVKHGTCTSYKDTVTSIGYYSKYIMNNGQYN